jgi:hypothetical protein
VTLATAADSPAAKSPASMNRLASDRQLAVGDAALIADQLITRAGCGIAK